MNREYPTLALLYVVCLFLLVACEPAEETDFEPENTSSVTDIEIAPNADPADAADTVFYNGNVYTPSSSATAEAVAVRDGRIQFVGGNDEIDAYIGTETVTVDLQGAMLIPGFIDFHNHFAEGGATICFPDNELNLEQQKDLLAECTADISAGEWIIGYGAKLEIALGVYGDRVTQTPIEVLDEVFPDNPVIIMEQTSHAMFANSYALEEAGITADTPDPQGGKIMHDDDGSLLGVLVDNAGDVVMELAENSDPNQFDLNYMGILYGQEELKKVGITTVGDGRTYWQRGMLDAWYAAEENGDLEVRVSVRPWIYPALSLEEQLPILTDAYQNDINQKIIVNQVKMYIDGVPENGTARVIEPYSDTYFRESPNGINYITEEAMVEWLFTLDELGYGAHVHAIGDLGIRETLNAFEALRDAGSDADLSITHVFMVDPDDLGRFAELDIVADIQVGETPQRTHTSRSFDYSPFIGQVRALDLYYRPVGELHESGAAVTLSSDWTVYDLNPLTGISVALAEESFTDPRDAIDAYTIRPAEGLGIDSLTGSIEVGKSADFAILTDDITQLEPNEIQEVNVVMTVFAGEIIYPQQNATLDPILFARETDNR